MRRTDVNFTHKLSCWQQFFSSTKSFNAPLLFYLVRAKLWFCSVLKSPSNHQMLYPRLLSQNWEKTSLKAFSVQKQAYLLSWCLWRGPAALWCSGCCEAGGGVPHCQPVRLHLSCPQVMGWWEELSGSGTPRKERTKHSSPVALSPYSGTWHSRSARKEEARGHLHAASWERSTSAWGVRVCCIALE